MDSQKEAENYPRKFLFLNEFEKGKIPSNGFDLIETFFGQTR